MASIRISTRQCETLHRGWFNVGPPSQSGLSSRVCWAAGFSSRRAARLLVFLWLWLPLLQMETRRCAGKTTRPPAAIRTGQLTGTPGRRHTQKRAALAGEAVPAAGDTGHACHGHRSQITLMRGTP